MYLQGHRFTPAVGKNAELKRLLADHITHLQGQGQRILLTERIFSSEGPGLTTSHFAPDLSDIDRIRRARLTDEDFQSRVRQWLPTLQESPRASLWESVVEGPPNPASTPIIEYVFVYPAIGQERRILDVLSGMVGELQKTGHLASLWRQIYSSDGPRLMIAGRYSDLAALDHARKARTEIVGRAVAAVLGLTRAPSEGRLSETVVALPPA